MLSGFELYPRWVPLQLPHRKKRVPLRYRYALVPRFLSKQNLGHVGWISTVE